VPRLSANKSVSRLDKNLTHYIIIPIMRTIIKAHNLSKYFNGFCAVDKVNFDIHEGEIFGFLGPNGAGKTTTVRMINCFFQPTSGTLSVDGLNVLTQKREIKRMLGVAPQDDNLDPDFTVEKNLFVYARYYNMSKKKAGERIEYLLELFKLSDRRKDIIEHLSGGLKKRLILVRALINEPKILLLDEPTTGLDPQARHLLWEKIRDLKREGFTIILTTHYMDEAFELCVRVAIMNEGNILEIDSPQALIEKYIGNKVLELEIPSGKEQDKIYSNLISSELRVERFGDKIFVFLKEEEIPSIEGVNQIIRDANLEDVFLHLTGRELARG
jgi:lipooligosaccharide transport system ATP-binding protein